MSKWKTRLQHFVPALVSRLPETEQSFLFTKLSESHFSYSPLVLKLKAIYIYIYRGSETLTLLANQRRAPLDIRDPFTDK